MWVSMLKKMFVFNFNFFFDKLSLNVFGGVLACKLKPFSTSLHVWHVGAFDHIHMLICA